MRKLLSVAVGLGLILAWWQFTGHSGSGGGATASKIPEKIFGGGGGTVTVSMDVSDPAKVVFDFGKDPDGQGSYKQRLTAVENMPAGHHDFTMDVAPATSARLEVEAVGPKNGSTISWTVTSGDRRLHANQIRLDGGLGANEAFFDNVEFEDLVAGKLGEL